MSWDWQVFCQDTIIGSMGASCKDGALCNTRNDADQSCDVGGPDISAAGFSIYFGLGPQGFPVGPFDP